MTIATSPSPLRQSFLDTRAQLTPTRKREEAQAIGGHLTDFLRTQPVGVLGIYWPIDDELDLRDFWPQWMSAGWQLALPCTTKGQLLIFRELTNSSPMHKGLFDIFEPTAENTELLPTFLVVPVVASDPHGARIGYGGGYYDRTLAKWRQDGWHGKAIGACFSCQISKEPLPQQPHDQALDGVLCPQGWLKPLINYGVTKA